jgi:hypothetical protein
LEKALDTPAHIYYKYEGVAPVGSHKPNTAVAQAFYAKEEGVTGFTTETGAGQWGSALSMACNMFGLECQVYMVKVSYNQKPYRRILIQSYGASVTPSPSDKTQYGRKVLAESPDSPGSLGIAISEAVEAAATSNGKYKYSLGSVLGPVLMHQLNEPVTRRGNTHQFFAPVSVYPTRDGYIYMAVSNDRQWAAITELPAFAGLARPEYERNAGRIADAPRLNQQLAHVFKEMMTNEALELFRVIGVPVSRVNTIAEVAADPLVAGELTPITDPRSGLTVTLPASPAGETPPLAFPLRLGEHNKKIYGEVLGYDDEALANLRKRGII